MATFRIYEDQENPRMKTLSQGVGVQHMKQRVVLGELQGNCHRATKNDFCKDEKMKTKVLLAHGELPFSIFDEQIEEKEFKTYEDKLKKETLVALRDTTKETKIDEKVVVNLEKENAISCEQVKVQVKNCIESVKVLDQCFVDKDTSLENYKNEAKSKRDFTKSCKDSEYFDVQEYRADIYQYLRVTESQCSNRPKPGYMRKQNDINYSMRAILVEWLIEVTEEYKLQNETLHLAISYIDRFLSIMSVARAKLQLLGTAAMFIATKYEEVYPPEMAEFIYITDETYSKKQILKMEQLILRVLMFNLMVPTPIAFLTFFCTNNNLPNRVKNLAMYFCELALMESDPFLQYVPSVISASAIALAQHTFLEEVWPHELELSSGYSLSDLKDCIINLTIAFRNAPNLPQKAVIDKYKTSKYNHVSLMVPRKPGIFESQTAATP